MDMDVWMDGSFLLLGVVCDGFGELLDVMMVWYWMRDVCVVGMMRVNY